ncbi:hypothetical protein [Lyngbya aestuarii]|uniref:hypothetical protein n=1 Tax=Lyngbya aestuarii TaxID=118322 RepID=UPI00403E2357
MKITTISNFWQEISAEQAETIVGGAGMKYDVSRSHQSHRGAGSRRRKYRQGNERWHREYSSNYVEQGMGHNPLDPDDPLTFGQYDQGAEDPRSVLFY